MFEDLPIKPSALIRNMLPEIEETLARGVTRMQVWEVLREENGLTLEFHAFVSALLRARAKKRADCVAPVA